MNITLITLNSGDVEGHRAGCQDVARKMKSFRGTTDWTFEVNTKHEAFLNYNSDFLDEGTEEADCYQISWLPCANALPAN